MGPVLQREDGADQVERRRQGRRQPAEVVAAPRRGRAGRDHVVVRGGQLPDEGDASVVAGSRVVVRGGTPELVGQPVQDGDLADQGRVTGGSTRVCTKDSTSAQATPTAYASAIRCRPTEGGRAPATAT